MKIWLVGKYIHEAAWECGGVFDTEEKAVAACHDYRYFVAPLIMNEIAPRESIDFPGAYYPKIEKCKVTPK